MRRYLVFGLLFFLLSTFALAQKLPIPSRTKDPRYLERDPAKRKAFFQAQEELVKQIKAKLQKFEAKNPEEKKVLQEALELLNNLPLFWQKIDLELSSKPETEAVVLPTLKKPPYSLEDLQKLLAIGFQLRHELEALKGKLRLEEEELDRLEKALEEIYRDYLVLTEKTSPKTFLRLAEFLNLQARWALAKIELNRTSEKIKRLSLLEDSWEALLQKVFAKLKVVPKELLPFKKALQEAQQQEEALKVRNQKLRETAERDLALLEIRLAKLGHPRSSLGQLKGKYYEVRRENIEIQLEQLDTSEKLASLKVEHQEFWLNLVTCLSNCSRKRIWDTLDHYQKRLDQLDTIKESVRYRRGYLAEKLIIVRSNLALHQDEVRQTKNNSRAYYLRLIINEEKNLLKNLEDLQNLLQKESELLQKYTFESETIISLWKGRLSFWEKTFARLRKIYNRSESTLKSIFYYPLWKSGSITFTVLSLVKLLFVLVIGIVILKIVRRKLERFLIIRLGMTPGVVNSLSTLTYYILLCLLTLVALSSAGVNLSQIALIFGALSVGIGFGLQTIANNFISGIILLSERSIKVGDMVQLEDGTLGIIQKINIRSTVIRTFDALEIIVPNSEFISQRISTWTYDDDWRRLIIPFGVSYQADPRQVEEVAIKAARQVPYTKENPDKPILVRFVGFGESSLDFELAVWIRIGEARKATRDIKSYYYYALHQALTEAGIEIPYPQRDIHLRSIYPEVTEGLKKAMGEG